MCDLLQYSLWSHLNLCFILEVTAVHLVFHQTKEMNLFRARAGKYGGWWSHMVLCLGSYCCISHFLAQLVVAGFSFQRPGFSPSIVHVGLVNRVARAGFSEHFGFPQPVIILPVLHIRLSSEAGTVGPFEGHSIKGLCLIPLQLFLLGQQLVGFCEYHL
jgi:hypothetical protein